MKKSLFAIVSLTASLSYALAAPVVVTPGTNASYMYFPPSSISGVASGGADVGSLQTCRVMPAGAGAQHTPARGDRTIDLSTRNWFGYDKPIKVYFSLMGASGGSSLGGGGGSTAILKNGVVVAVGKGGDGAIGYTSVWKPELVNGTFELSKTDTIRIVLGGGGASGGVGQYNGSYTDYVIMWGGGGAGYYGGAGGGYAIVEDALRTSYYGGTPPPTVTVHKGGSATAPGARGNIVWTWGGAQGVSGVGSTGGYVAAHQGGWHSASAAATLTTPGRGGSTRMFSPSSSSPPYLPIGPAPVGGGGAAGYGGGWNAFSGDSYNFDGADGYGFALRMVNTVNAERFCHPKSYKFMNPNVWGGGCSSADFPVPAATEGMALPDPTPSMSGMVLLQYQAPTCGILPNYDQN